MRTLSLSWGFISCTTSMFLLSGCATFSQDGGFSKVQELTQDRIGKEVKWVKSDTDSSSVEAIIHPLLAKPLSVDDAVTIALLNNKGLQASYAELGIAEANLIQAWRLPNPTFSFGRLMRGDELEIDRKLTLPVLSLLTIPITTRLEKRRFEHAQLLAASEVLRIANETRRAYFSAVAAQETAKYMERVKIAAEAGANLGQRMAAVGNWSTLQQAREHSLYADATAQLARAKQTYQFQREELTRLLGLWGSSIAFQLPDRLPELPKAPKNLVDVEALGLQNRLDIMMAKRELASLADSLSLIKTTRFINVLDASYLRNGYNASPSHATGYEIQLQIPLFDWGTARVAKAETLYMQAVNRTAEIAINARSEIRQSYSNYQSAYDLARHYRDEVVPLKKRVSNELLLRYNGMLISVFELLADARQQAITVNSSIEALRDYWIADSVLQMALTGRSTEISTSEQNRPTNQNAEPTSGGH